MFTDMVGYTAMMQENETLAKHKRDRHRGVLRSVINAHNGEILQFFGDGTLSIFNSSVEAVSSAVTIQQQLMEDPSIPLRIGIHTSDIVVDEEGIYGDGVNVASRIESLSIPGSVLVSEKVFDDLKNHPDYPVQFLGSFELKNVKKPLEIYAIDKPALQVPSAVELMEKTTSHFKSISVLPFVNMSSDKENDYLGDGLSEEIINALSHIQGIKVTSRTSAFAFRGQNIDIREIGRRLGVSTILEGSVRKFGSRIRVTAQLVNTKDGYHFWSETYDRKLQDIFELQDDITREIVSKLQKTMGYKYTIESLVKSQTENIDAYNLYLKGKYLKNKFNPPDIKKAITHLEKAIALQPDFASPYPVVAYCYGFLGTTGHMQSEKAIEMSKRYLETALKLDETNYEAYLIKGMGDLYFTGNYKGAYDNLQKAKALNPGAADVHHFYAQLMLSIENLKEAEENLEKALELDPLSLQYKANMATLKSFMGQYDISNRICDEILELDPNFRSAWENKGWNYFFKNEIEQSIRAFSTYQKMTGSPYKGLTGLAYVYGRMGEYEKVNEMLSLLSQRAREEPETSLEVDFAIIYAGMQQFDKAREYLDNTMQKRSGALMFLIHPLWNEAKKDPSFLAFIDSLKERSLANQETADRS